MLYSWSLFCYLPGRIEGFWVLMRSAWIMCKGTWFWHVIVKIIRSFLYRWPFRLSPKRSAWKIEHLPFFCANSTCRVNEFFLRKHALEAAFAYCSHTWYTHDCINVRWRMTMLFWLTCTVYVNTRWFWSTMMFSFHLLFVSTNRTKAEKAKPVRKPVRLCSFSLSFKFCTGFYYYGEPPPATTFRQRLPFLGHQFHRNEKQAHFFICIFLSCDHLSPPHSCFTDGVLHYSCHIGSH